MRAWPDLQPLATRSTRLPKCDVVKSLVFWPDREQSVGDLVDSMGVTQPQVSKHLRVLREVGLVSVRDEGRLRWYRLNAEELKPIYDWAKTFERFWDHQLSSIKARAEAKSRAAKKKTN